MKHSGRNNYRFQMTNLFMSHDTLLNVQFSLQVNLMGVDETSNVGS